ncbi:MAG TPA: divergent polysaccharide deacetylase family protein, partial [Thermodesulfovibrionia bacterium]|nr:divergent polysaccharide deacetylase family protein [Thermodesulfovibrionia bacterium]
MPQKKPSKSKKSKPQKTQGRTPSKSKFQTDTPGVVYVFLILVLGILAFSLYHDHVRNRPHQKKAEKQAKPDPQKKQPIEKPGIVQDKRQKEPVPQEKPVQRQVEAKSEPDNEEALLTEEKKPVQRQVEAKSEPDNEETLLTEEKKPAQRQVQISQEPNKDETLQPENLLLAKRFAEKMPDRRQDEPLWPEEQKPEHRKQPIKPSFFRPKVAVVIDDMGGSKKEAMELFSVRANLTFSILPNQPYSEWVAEEGHRRGHNIMAHVPMEPKDSKKNPGQGGLYLSMSHREIQETFNRNIDSIPYVVGFNNHMGSAFTRDIDAMKTVMAATNGRHLFFLDSRTVPKSVGVAAAKNSGLRAFGRDVFLDHDNDPASIEKQWDELIEIAKEKGQAIAIGHPYDNTIAFL